MVVIDGLEVGVTGLDGSQDTERLVAKDAGESRQFSSWLSASPPRIKRGGGNRPKRGDVLSDEGEDGIGQRLLSFL